MMGMRIARIRAEPRTYPLNAPFAIARRTALEAQVVRITVETECAGLTGCSEAAPVGYVTGESVESVVSAIESVVETFVGQSVQRLQPLWAYAARELTPARAARAGLEMALCDAWGKYWGLPLWQHFGGARKTLTTDLTIPLVSPEEAGALAGDALRDGFRHLKIKVGDSRGHEADLARVERIVQSAPGAKLRIDANQAFAADEAVAFAQTLAKFGAEIEMIEQPVPKDDDLGLKYVKDRLSIPVFADEAARDIADVRRLLQQDAVDGINIKLMKSGLSGALEIISLCRAAHKTLMLGCMLESHFGIAAAAHLAAGTGAFDLLDLDSCRLLAPTPGLDGGFTAAGDILDVSDAGSGWGVAIPE
jgi:L-alanine-DL-glutamate epimerase-like enolase superfamily enzyme